MAIKVLITGGNGLIATCLKEQLDSQTYVRFNTTIANCYTIYDFPKEELDVTDFNRCKEVFSTVKPDIVIHCACMISVDQCQKYPERAYEINVSGTRNIAVCCQKLDIPMFYFSSCSVFDGKRDIDYRVWDQTNSISDYAFTKIAAENEIKSLLNKFYILRSAYVYGKNDNLVTPIIKRFKEEKCPDFPVIDQILGITSVKDLCSATIDLTKSGRYGIYHYSHKGCCTRKTLVNTIAKILDKKDFIFSTYQEDGLRSKYVTLDTQEIQPYLSKPIPYWSSALEDFIKENQCIS